MKINDITRRNLHEDAESDQSKYERAQEVVKMITSYAWEHNDPEDNYGFVEIELRVEGENGKHGGTMYGITPAMINNTRFPKDLMIAVAVGGGNANGSLIAHPGLAAHFPGVKYMIALYYLHRPDAEQARVKLSGNMRLLKTLLHELVHYFDNKDHDLIAKYADADGQEKKRKKPYPDEKAKTSAYYNNSMETNAFFHVVAEKLTQLISDFRQHPADAQDYAELYDFSPDFKTMLRMTLRDFKIGTDSAMGFLTHLSQPKYRRIVGRLYKLHQLALQELEKAKGATATPMRQAA